MDKHKVESDAAKEMDRNEEADEKAEEAKSASTGSDKKTHPVINSMKSWINYVMSILMEKKNKKGHAEPLISAHGDQNNRLLKVHEEACMTFRRWYDSNCVGVVGLPGSGKSTILNTLLNSQRGDQINYFPTSQGVRTKTRGIVILTNSQKSSYKARLDAVNPIDMQGLEDKRYVYEMVVALCVLCKALILPILGPRLPVYAIKAICQAVKIMRQFRIRVSWPVLFIQIPEGEMIDLDGDEDVFLPRRFVAEYIRKFCLEEYGVNLPAECKIQTFSLPVYQGRNRFCPEYVNAVVQQLHTPIRKIVRPANHLEALTYLEKIVSHMRTENFMRMYEELFKQPAQEAKSFAETQPRERIANVLSSLVPDAKDSSLKSYYKECVSSNRPLTRRLLEVQRASFHADRARNKKVQEAFTVLTKFFDQNGVNLSLCDKKDKSDLKRIHDPNPPMKLNVALRLPNSFLCGKTVEDLNNDELMRQMQFNRVRVRVSSCLEVPIETVMVTGCRKGSVIFDVVVDYDTIVPSEVRGRMTPDMISKQKTIFQKKEKIIEEEFQKDGVKSVNIDVVQHKLKLSAHDFDKRGDFAFPNPKGDTQSRGGVVYHQPPKGWKRIGLFVEGLYDDGNNDWLHNWGKKGWAILFHGTSTPRGIKPIVVSRTIAPGRRNVFEGRPSSNGKGRIPNGIYFAEKVENCYQATVTHEGCVYQVAFQCRVRPDKIYRCGNSNGYCVVANPEHVRPYGILLKKN